MEEVHSLFSVKTMDGDSIKLVWQRVRQAHEQRRTNQAANGEWLTETEETVLLQELFQLIDCQFGPATDGSPVLVLALREDSRRKRLIATLQIDDPKVTHADDSTLLPPNGAAARDLQATRMAHMQAICKALGISCTDMTSRGQLTGYTLVMPLPPPSSPGHPTPMSAVAGLNAKVPDSSSQGNAPPAPSDAVTPTPPVDSEKKRKKRAELKQFFIASLVQDQEKLATAQQAGDWETVRKVAHQLKGCAASFGFPEVTEQAKTLDELIKSERTTDYHAVCTSLLETLRQIA